MMPESSEQVSQLYQSKRGIYNVQFIIVTDQNNGITSFLGSSDHTTTISHISVLRNSLQSIESKYLLLLHSIDNPYACPPMVSVYLL